MRSTLDVARTSETAVANMLPPRTRAISTCFAVSINSEEHCTFVSVIHINMEIMPGLRKIIGCACVVLIAIAMMMVRVRGSVSDDISKIVALINNVEKAFSDGDLDAYASLYTEDCRFISTGVPEVRGRAGQPHIKLFCMRICLLDC